VASTCTLDLGDLPLGGAQATATLGLANDVLDPADDLWGEFALALGSFTGSGLGTADNAVQLAPGQSLGNLALGFLPVAVGSYAGNFIFTSRSHNAFEADWPLPTVTFRLAARVVDPGGIPIPEPGTLGLLLGAALAAGAAARRRQGARS
jgi:hypothetical protein